MNALEKSKCIIEAVLDRIGQDYPLTGGDGISSIRFVSSTTVEATMLQEERADVWLFAFELAADGQVQFTNITKTTR